MDPERLALLPDDQLWHFVRARLPLGNDWSHWLQGAVIARVREALIQEWTRMDDEQSLRDKQLPEAQAEELRMARSRTRRTIQARQAQVATAMKDYNRELTAIRETARDHQISQTIRELVIEVMRHRRATLAADMAPTTDDIRLWQCLSWLKVPGGRGEASLQQLFNQYWDGEAQDEQERA